MKNTSLHMNPPDIRSVYKVAIHYIKKMSGEFSKEQIEAANELKRRIKRMENDYNRLININGLISQAMIPKGHFDEATDTYTCGINGASISVKLKRADPNVPIKQRILTDGGAYSASESIEVDESEIIDKLKMEMESLLEHYYNSAFRVTKLIQRLTENRKYHCPEITTVRNRLIEHPEEGSIYSFGYGSNGPVVKNMYRGQKIWNDNGLIPNTAALMESLMIVFSVDNDDS